MSKPTNFLIFVAGWFVFGPLPVAGADWPSARGNANATGATAEALPADLQLLWKHSAGESGYEATAVISAGIVYVGDVDGTFSALRLADGSEVWNQKFEDAGFIAGAAIADNRLFVGDFNGIIRALDASDGALLWQAEAKGESYAAPNALAERVLVTSEAGELLSLDPASGELQWQFQIEAPLRCWPTVVEGRVLLAGCDERLHAVDVLTGMRIGVMRSPDVDSALFDAAMARLKEGGAEIVLLDTSKIDFDKMGEAEFKVLLAELKADLADYLRGLPEGLAVHKTLADIVAFNKANADRELQHFGQDIFELADKENGLNEPAYIQALATSRRLAKGALNGMFINHRLDVIVAQTNGPAWLSTLGKGDAFSGPSASQMPAIAGYPHLTVPMGLSGGLPVGLSLIGPEWHDHAVLKAGYAYEQLSKARVSPVFQERLESK